MSLILPLAGLIASGAGTAIQALQNVNANKPVEDFENKATELILADKYASPLDSITTKSLLSKMDRRLNKQEEAIANHAAAGGATFENTLAAKQASNEAMADVVSGVMEGEQARQTALNNQLLSIEQQKANRLAESKRASGAGWASLGDSVFGAMNTLGGTMLENDIPLSELFKFKKGDK